MIRATRPGLGLLSLALLIPASAALAQQSASSPTRKTKSSAHRKASAHAKSAVQAAVVKPNLIGTFGDWGAYVALGKDRTCYVLAQPKERLPATLKRDPAYIFISTRPAEHVHNEVSIVEGFDVRTDGATDARAEIGKTSFDMVAKGSDLWLKDGTQEAQMITAMRKSGRLVVKASSLKGNLTTDTYSLDGLTQALDHVLKSCK
jgi:hypothetical protein